MVRLLRIYIALVLCLLSRITLTVEPGKPADGFQQNKIDLGEAGDIRNQAKDALNQDLESEHCKQTPKPPDCETKEKIKDVMDQNDGPLKEKSDAAQQAMKDRGDLKPDQKNPMDWAKDKWNKFSEGVDKATKPLQDIGEGLKESGKEIAGKITGTSKEAPTIGEQYPNLKTPGKDVANTPAPNEASAKAYADQKTAALNESMKPGDAATQRSLQMNNEADLKLWREWQAQPDSPERTNAMHTLNQRLLEDGIVTNVVQNEISPPSTPAASASNSSPSSSTPAPSTSTPTTTAPTTNPIEPFSNGVQTNNSLAYNNVLQHNATVPENLMRTFEPTVKIDGVTLNYDRIDNGSHVFKAPAGSSIESAKWVGPTQGGHWEVKSASIPTTNGMQWRPTSQLPGGTQWYSNGPQVTAPTAMKNQMCTSVFCTKKSCPYCY